MVGDAGIEVDRERRGIRRIGGGGRDAAEVEIEILDLAGEVAAEVGLEAGPRRPARLGSVIVEAEADGRGDGVAVIVETRAETWDRARGLDLGDGQPAGEIH